MGLSEAVVEKDFWVCWTLNQIFTIEQFKERLLFKGGTSLSKVFGAIQRLSGLCRKQDRGLDTIAG